MPKPILALLAAAVVVAESQAAQAQRTEIENAAAFARLYGVVRYFYPGDAAATLDWNRFAVHGVKQVRATPDVRRLESALKDLFGPLGTGIEIATNLGPAPSAGAADSSLIAWRYFGPGVAPPTAMNVYRAKRTNRALAVATAMDGFVSMMQTLPADAWRGKAIRLRAQVRATARDAAGAARLWLRVDRPNQQQGFFDNMADRPIRDSAWREHAIEGTVAADAMNVAFGPMALGDVTADFDAVVLEIRDADGQWMPVAVKDPGFEASDAPGSTEWRRVGTATNVSITRPADKAPEGRQFLRLAPLSGPVSNAELFEGAIPAAGDHVDVDLGQGLKARVRLTLSNAEATVDASRTGGLDALRTALQAMKESNELPDLDVRLADVVVTWNVFRHFYPYWTEAGVDWDGRLQPRLESAYEAPTRDAHVEALRRLVADARDGHGGVNDSRRPASRSRLPVQLGMMEGQIVITASGVPADAPVGGIVSTINGVPAVKRITERMELVSGTTQWKQNRALIEMSSCPTGSLVNLTVDNGSGPRQVDLRCDAAQPPPEKRPNAVTELDPGMWYIDLTRAQMAQLKPVLPKLGTASGVVFDVRGYPTELGFAILPHLIDSAESDRWMHIAKVVGPSGRFVGWQSFGWDLKPASPRIAGKIVFLTDGRAISYAESVMGYVADRKLGNIVGSTTAGTNGNVATFVTPGGFTVGFTGMRVTGHDGKAPYHLVGVKPDIPVSATIAGLRAGRDEVLERGLAAIRR